MSITKEIQVAFDQLPSRESEEKITPLTESFASDVEVLMKYGFITKKEIENLESVELMEEPLLINSDNWKETKRYAYSWIECIEYKNPSYDIWELRWSNWFRIQFFSINFYDWAKDLVIPIEDFIPKKQQLESALAKWWIPKIMTWFRTPEWNYHNVWVNAYFLTREGYICIDPKGKTYFFEDNWRDNAFSLITYRKNKPSNRGGFIWLSRLS